MNTATSVLQIGSFHVTLLGLFSMIGAVAGLAVLRHETRRKSLPIVQVYNAALIAFAAAIIGAKAYYVLFFSSLAFPENVAQAFTITRSGLSIQGALIGGVLGSALYLRRTGISFWSMADAAAPAVILGQAIGRIGCDVFGVEASERIRWSVQVGGRALHPAQLYESLLNYLLFIVLWALRDRTRRSGDLFLIYLMGFSFNRFIVEFVRVNPLVVGPFTVAHATSAAFFVVALGAWRIRHKPADAGSRRQPHHAPPLRGETAAGVVGLMVLSIATYYLLYR